MRKLLALFATLFLLGAVASCSSDSGSNEAFCDQAEAMNTGLDDPQAFLDALDELIDDAPSSIKGDLETLRDAYESFADIDENDPEALAQASAAFEEDDVIEAGENIEAFGEEECGIEPDPTLGG